MFELLAYGFVQRAIIIGICIALICSLLGTFLILKRLALIGDGISHIAFGGVAIGLLVGFAPLWSAIFFAVIGGLAIYYMKKYVHGDVAIAIVSYLSLGFGILIISSSSGFNVDVISYLFGSILGTQFSEVIFSLVLLIVVLGFLFYFKTALLSLCFDEESALVSGVPVLRLEILLTILTAITIATAMNIVGLLLASALLVIPAASALQLKRNFSWTLVIAGFFAVCSVVLGLFLSYTTNTAPSGMIVMINGLFFLVSAILGRYL